MSQYLRIAEKVYHKVEKNKRFMSEPAEDLNTLMIEIKEAILGTQLKLLYNYIDFENLMMYSTHAKIKLDLTIIPKISSSQEFTLWLASFIEKITQGKKTKLPALKHKHRLPKYAMDEQLIRPSNNGQDIIDYFIQKKEHA